MTVPQPEAVGKTQKAMVLEADAQVTALTKTNESPGCPGKCIAVQGTLQIECFGQSIYATTLLTCSQYRQERYPEQHFLLRTHIHKPLKSYIMRPQPFST